MEKIKAARVSVIVPVYNAEKTLARCIDSVLAQTMPDFELLLVDNNATDGSPAILRAYAARDPRVLPLHAATQGVSPARNRGIDAAGGEYVFFLDSDDTLAPSALEILVREADATQCGIVFPSIERLQLRSDGNISERSAPDVQDARPQGQQAIARTFAAGLRRYACFNPAALYRRALLEQAPALRFDAAVSLGEDVLLNMAVMARSSCISILRAPLYRYYFQFGGESLNAKYRPDMVAIKGMLAHHIRAFVAERGAWDAAAEQSYAIMLAQDVFLCVANLFRGPKAERRTSLRVLLGAPWVASLVQGRKKWAMPAGKRLFLDVLATRSYALAALAVRAYRLLNR